MGNKSITSRDIDFAQWYTDVVKASKLADYSSVKGCIVIEPRGYAIWEKMQAVLDKKFKELGHVNVNMPLLIPESMLAKEGELIEGFAPECAWVTQGGSGELEERFAIRPTSETLFCDYYSRKIKSYRDLPMLFNQWVNVLRWEKETRPFLRSREFLWQEGHTAHASAEEAEKETKRMLEVYKWFFEEYLAMPVITGRKTELEKFAGAEYSLTVEAQMYNGYSLQSGTSHYFGQKFAKAYEVTFLNKENKKEFAYQTSWGVTTRMIGGLIMTHSDNFGLVLPPKIAPMQVVVVPIGTNEDVIKKSDEIVEMLQKAGISCFADKSDKTPGFKFAEHEVNGVPVRIEFGERDMRAKLVTIARRDTRERSLVDLECDLVEYVKNLLDCIQKDMYQIALERRNRKTYDCLSLREIEYVMNTNVGFVRAMWCGCKECELEVKKIRGTKSRCILEDERPISDKCVVCGKPAKHLVVWGLQY